MRFSIFKKGLLLFLVPLLFHLIFIWRLVITRAQSTEAEGWYLHTKEVISQVNLFFYTIIKGQNALRGYAITRDELFIAALESANAEIPLQFEQLKTLVSDNPDQMRRLEVMAEKMRLILGIFIREKVAVTEGRQEEVLALIKSLHTHALIAELEKNVKAFIAYEELLDSERHRALSGNSDQINQLLVLGSLLAVAITIFLLWAFTRGVSRRIEHLVKNMEGYRPGQAISGKPLSGQDEIVQLDLSFRAMTTVIDSALEKEREHHETLESKVIERTADLQKTNDELKAEIRRRQRAEIELKRSNRDLQDFALVASHDLQESLRKVRTFGDRLLEDFAEQLGPDGRAYIERMSSAVARMQSLITDILSISRLTSKAQAFQTVDLGALIQQVWSDLEARVLESEAHLDLVEIPAIEAEPSHMRQLFQNLLGNALKFRRPGIASVIKISLATELDLAPVAAPPELLARSLSLSIEDNGIGFEQQYAERIFGIFQRLHGRLEFEGTGIGLAVCRKIVEFHSGVIAAYGVPGKGSKFILILPYTHAAADADSKAS